MISDMRSAHLGPTQLVIREPQPIDVPEDVYYQISMGADIGHLPQDSLVTVTGAPESRVPAQKAYVSPGDFVVVAGKDDKILPIVLGVLVELIQHNGDDHGLPLGSRDLQFFHVVTLWCFTLNIS